MPVATETLRTLDRRMRKGEEKMGNRQWLDAVRACRLYRHNVLTTEDKSLKNTSYGVGVS